MLWNEIPDVMASLYEKNWITMRDGNASFRFKDAKIISITPSGAVKPTIKSRDLLELKIVDNQLQTTGDKKILSKPSGELHMHWMLLKNTTENRAVVHAHPTHIIAAMYAGFDLQDLAKEFLEVYRNTKVAPNVPNLPAVSKELGDVTYEHLAGIGYPEEKTKTSDLAFDIVGQANHGVCAVGKTPWEAFEHIERLDHICEIVLKSGIK